MADSGKPENKHERIPAGGEGGGTGRLFSFRGQAGDHQHSIPVIVPAIGFVIGLFAVISVAYLHVFWEYFQGYSFFWVLCAGLTAMIISLMGWLALRDQSYLSYAEGLLEEMAVANRGLRLLLDVARRVGYTLELDPILEEVLEQTFAVSNADMGAIYLLDRGEDLLRLVMVKGVEMRKMMFKELPMGKGLVGEAASSRQMITFDDISKIDESDKVFFGAASPGSQAVMPLTARERLVGVLITAADGVHEYTRKEERLLRGFVEIVGLAITNAELYRIARKSLDMADRQRGFTASMLEEMVAGVITADRDGRIHIFNPEARRLTGYDFAEKAQMPLRPEASPDENPLGPLEHRMLQALKTPTKVVEGETFIMKKDKTLLPISYRIYPLVSGDEVLGVAAVFMESTRVTRETSREEGIDYQVLLRSLGARIERLYTHPLSRVLDRVRGMGVEEWSQSRESMLSILEAGTAALLGLLEDVERYLNCTTVREWDTPGEHDIVAVVGQVVMDILKLPEYGDVVVLVKLEEMRPAYGYGRMIRSAISEVVENAVIAASEGGGKVEISGREADGFVRLEVRDAGPGISSEVREFMYLPFFTTREGRAGLGLATVSRVMQRMEGRVGLEEVSGEGALMYLEFPAAIRLEGEVNEGEKSPT